MFLVVNFELFNLSTNDVSYDIDCILKYIFVLSLITVLMGNYFCRRGFIAINILLQNNFVYKLSP